MDNKSVFIQNVTRDMVLQEKAGKQCSAVEVFTLSIKAFVDDFMKHLEGTHVMQHEVLWVLTVSAAWTDSAKQLMRESAEKVRFSKTYLHHRATKFEIHNLTMHFFFI
jgi:urate oxidase